MWRLIVAEVEGVGACWLLLRTMARLDCKVFQERQWLGSRGREWGPLTGVWMLVLEVGGRPAQKRAVPSLQRGRQESLTVAGNERQLAPLRLVPSNTKKRGQQFNEGVVMHSYWLCAHIRIDGRGNGILCAARASRFQRSSRL
jgi:hypothetical protein